MTPKTKPLFRAKDCELVAETFGIAISGVLKRNFRDPTL